MRDNPSYDFATNALGYPMRDTHDVSTCPPGYFRRLCRPLHLNRRVAKSRYPRVIRKAGVQRRRPFRVLGPFLATTRGTAASLKDSLSARRAHRLARPGVAPLARSRPRLSVVSLSRAAWVNGRWFRPHRSQPPGVAFGSFKRGSSGDKYLPNLRVAPYLRRTNYLEASVILGLANRLSE